MVFKLKYIAPHCGGIKRGRRPARPGPSPSPPPLAAARGRHGAALRRAGPGLWRFPALHGGAILEAQWQGLGTRVC